MTFARHDVQIVIQDDKLQHAPVRRGGIVGQTVAKVAISALGVRMTRLLLHLLAGHGELGIVESGHPVFIRVALDALGTGLVTGVEIDEEQNKGELDEKDAHPAFAAEECPKFVDGHDE